MPRTLQKTSRHCLCPSCRYPKEYKGPRPIVSQITALAAAFDLDPRPALRFVDDLPNLPVGAEGWFAILSTRISAPWTSNFNAQYCRAVRTVLGLSETIYCPYPVKSNHLHQTKRTAEAVWRVEVTQSSLVNSGILIIAAQLGLRHQGRSMRECIDSGLRKREFGLNMLMASSIALTHKKRFAAGWPGFNSLGMDLPGDIFSNGEISPSIGGSETGGVKFEGRMLGSVSHGYGSATGFFPPGW